MVNACGNKLVLINPATGKPLKPPKPPEKPLMPYMRYSRKVWDQVKATHKESKLWEIGRIIGQMWRELPAEEKTKYNHEWETEKVEYAKAMEVYQNSPSYQQYLVAKEKAAAAAGLPRTTELSSSGAVVVPHNSTTSSAAANSDQGQSAAQSNHSSAHQTSHLGDRDGLGGGSGVTISKVGGTPLGGIMAVGGAHGHSSSNAHAQQSRSTGHSLTSGSGRQNQSGAHPPTAAQGDSDTGRLSMASIDNTLCVGAPDQPPSRVTEARNRFERNHRLIHEILSECTVPDARSAVTVPRLQMLKRQATSLAQHQKKLEAELEALDSKFRAKRQKVDDLRRAFHVKLKEVSQPTVDESAYAQMLVKAQVDLVNEYQTHLRTQNLANSKDAADVKGGHGAPVSTPGRKG